MLQKYRNGMDQLFYCYLSCFCHFMLYFLSILNSKKIAQYHVFVFRNAEDHFQCSVVEMQEPHVLQNKRCSKSKTSRNVSSVFSLANVQYIVLDKYFTLTLALPQKTPSVRGHSLCFLIPSSGM